MLIPPAPAASRTRRVVASAAALFLAGSSLAQDAGATSNTKAIVMSPFEVNTDKDNGFMATDAGTATKLGLDLKDLAAPYSVMTGAFIKTLGIDDLMQAAIWATNGAPVLDGQGADLFAGVGGARTNSASTMYFARGVIMNAGQQRDFFLNSGTNDTYNIERIDFGRGPNAVLFNVGANDALGGGISTVGKRARVDRDFNTVNFTTGSWDYYRSTLDVNRVLSDRFALRGNFMWQKRGGWQMGEQDNRRGATLAATWRINNTTELNAEVRDDKIERSHPPVPFGDNLSGWDGSTVVNGPITNYQYDGKVPLTGTNQTLQTLPGGSSGQGQLEGIWREGDDWVYDPASGTVMNWLNMGSTRRGDENPWVPIYFNGQPWSRGGNPNLLPIGNWGATGGNTRTPSPTNDGGDAAFYNMIDLPADRFSRQVSGSKFRVPGPRDSLIPNVPLYTETTKGAHLNFSHKFSDDLYFEAQADTNTVVMRTVGPSTILPLRNLYIDINRNLPNGQPNPHFLDAYGESEMDRGYHKFLNSGVRAALAYHKDFGAWGDYTFNLSGMVTARDVWYRRYFYTLNLSSDPRDWHSYHMRVRYYQHDSNRPFYDATPTQVFNRTFVNQSGADNTYTTTTQGIKPSWTLDDWQDRKERNMSGIFALAARWFNDRLILTPGVRVGRQKTYLRLKPTSWGFLPNDPNWDGVTLDDRYWRPDAPADWKTLTWTPLDAKGNPLSSQPQLATGNRPVSGPLTGTRDVRPANPYYANDRFRGDYNFPQADTLDVNTTAGLTWHATNWMALKLSYGSSFLPADVGRFLLDGSDAKSETGIAYDAAVTFDLFHHRLAITPRYYFDRKNNTLGTPPIAGPINGLMGTRAWNETYPAAINPYSYNGVLGSDYYSSYNDGFELEVTGQITNGWRVSGSLGTARVNQYHQWPLSRAYVQTRQAELLKVLQAAGGALDTTQKPMDNGHPVNDAPGLAVPDPAVTDAMIRSITLIDGSSGDPVRRQRAVDDYNNIWVQYDQIANEKETIGLHRMTAKLVTDYTIQTGPFKGFRYGASVFYVDRDLAGYRGGDTLPNPNFNPKAPVTSTNLPWMDDPNVDYNTPVWVKRPFEVNALFGYTFRLPHMGQLTGSVLELQLNVKNVLNGRDVYYQDDGVTLRPPNGDINAPNRVAVPGRIASYQRPINFELSATLHF